MDEHISLLENKPVVGTHHCQKTCWTQTVKACLQTVSVLGLAADRGQHQHDAAKINLHVIEKIGKARASHRYYSKPPLIASVFFGGVKWLSLLDLDCYILQHLQQCAFHRRPSR